MSLIDDLFDWLCLFTVVFFLGICLTIIILPTLLALKLVGLI